MCQQTEQQQATNNNNDKINNDTDNNNDCVLFAVGSLVRSFLVFVACLCVCCLSLPLLL